MSSYSVVFYFVGCSVLFCFPPPNPPFFSFPSILGLFPQPSDWFVGSWIGLRSLLSKNFLILLIPVLDYFWTTKQLILELPLWDDETSLAFWLNPKGECVFPRANVFPKDLMSVILCQGWCWQQGFCLSKYLMFHIPGVWCRTHLAFCLLKGHKRPLILKLEILSVMFLSHLGQPQRYISPHWFLLQMLH